MIPLDDIRCDNQAMWSDWRLSDVQVRAAGAVIRGYTLAGEKPGNHWTLTGITRTGSGGSGQLPPYAFTYEPLGGDNRLFLTLAENGYGGSAGLSYLDEGDAFPACERNVVSANGSGGFNLIGADASQNLLAGNYIGTDASGSFDLGNARSGICPQMGASRNRFEGNLVSGTALAGSSWAGRAWTITWWPPTGSAPTPPAHRPSPTTGWGCSCPTAPLIAWAARSREKPTSSATTLWVWPGDRG